MAQQPAKTKYRKKQKGNFKGLAKRGYLVSFGDYGMQALDRAWVTNGELQACRVAISRSFNRKGKVWIRVFTDKPISKKPAETRMGKGKVSVDEWVATIRPGVVLFEVGNVSREEAQKALRLAAAKLSFATRFVERVEVV